MTNTTHRFTVHYVLADGTKGSVIYPARDRSAAIDKAAAQLRSDGESFTITDVR